MKKKYVTLILLVTVGFAVLSPAYAYVYWSAETRLTTHPSWDAGSSIVGTMGGMVWIVWQRENAGNWDLFYKVFNGAAWSDDVRLTSDGGHDTAPSIFQTAGGAVWVFWAADRSGNYNIYRKYSLNGGASWSNEVQLTSDPSDDVNPAFIEASNGVFWLVWSRKMASGYFDLFYKTSSDGGGSWSSEVRLTTDEGHDKLPSIAQMWDGRIWVAWSSSRTGGQEVFYKIRSGSSWSAEMQLTSSTDFLNSDPSIVQARDGSIFIVWSSRESKDLPSTNDNLFYKVSVDNGVSWSSGTQLTLDPDWDEVWPSIAQAGDGKLWVTYTSDKDNNYDIYYMTSNYVYIHDVAVIDVTASPILVYRDDYVSVDVTVENQGEAVETFDVTCYANSSVIGTKSVALMPGASTVVNFNWSTSGFAKGNYVMNARAVPPPDETVPSQGDNWAVGNVVRVKIPGDVDDSGAVNVMDLALIGVSFGKQVGEPLYNPNADITHDGVIDVSDLAVAGRNYGKRS